MPFAIGDRVHVVSLGTGRVREVRGRRYLVEIKGRALILGENQLSLMDPGRTDREVRQAPDPAMPSRPDAPSSIDLHGMTTAEADAALVPFISDALLAGHAEARVIHGRGGGRVKAAAHARLRSLPTVRSFRVDPQNPGVTIVVL
jgi:DNA mismatch repair protein MutS2